jgi:curli biogenesis system outer membrane secretion channel CsgG
VTRFSHRNKTGAILAAALAVAGAFAGLTAAPAVAAQGAAFYHAQLAAPLAAPRQEVLNGILWNCADSACTGTRGGSRALLECQRLSQKVGTIVSFAKGAETLDETALARCNG